jgi:hypothetical protein
VIVSSIPGRVRFRHAELCSRARAHRAHDALMALPGVTRVDSDPRTGSLLVRYDPAVVVESGIASALGLAPGKEHPRRPGALRVRGVPAGMAASLGVTLVAAVFKLKWLHVAAGLIFVGYVGVHVLGRGKPRDPSGASS